MSIVNPQYAFLEADYKNPNLTKVMRDEHVPDLNQVKVKVESTSKEALNNMDISGAVHTSLKNTLTVAFFRLNWKLGMLLWIPVENLFIGYLVLVEIFS